VVGSVTFLLFAANTFFWCLLLYAVTLLKLVVPIPAFRRAASRLLVAIGEAWIAVNTVSLRLTQPTAYDVKGLEGLRRDVSYLVVSNHQSWVDIPVLQGVFLRRIPFLRFFLKQQLIRVPFLGAAWWALDFPFMKRHSREALERNPDLRHEDLAATRRACEKFRHAPAAILNFVEGTRFTPVKHARGGAPYRHLLSPKAGGLAFAASAMGPQLAGIVDVTIVYPHGSPTFWDLISRGLPEVVVGCGSGRSRATGSRGTTSRTPRSAVRSRPGSASSSSRRTPRSTRCGRPGVAPPGPIGRRKAAWARLRPR
jgi:1-acyl-sn-glycerol-3-phosphate acyltransferase